MSLFPEYDSEVRNRLYSKNSLKIGIFGSFGNTRKKYIDSLKSFLISHSYSSTFDAGDFPVRDYQDKDEKYEIALENSEALLINSDIQIFFLYLEDDKDHGINISAAIEIAFLFKSKREDGVILIIEEGAEEQIRANLKGILAKGKKKNWVTIPFDSCDLTHEIMAESACYNYIGKMLYNSRDPYLDQTFNDG